MVNMVTNASTGWKPGEFAFMYFDIGQGDCMFAICPDGETIMVDCGSTSGFTEPQIKTIRGQLTSFLGKSKVLNHLVLTHPDDDHYSLVPRVLQGFKVENIYISCAPTTLGVGPLGKYKTNSVNNIIYLGSLKTDFIYDIVIRPDPNDDDEIQQYYRQWSKADSFRKSQTIPLTGDEFIINESSEGWVYAPFKVSIIAGNVKQRFTDPNRIPSPDTAVNRASLVTLFMLGEDTDENRFTAVSWGDATFTTENFVITTQTFSVDDSSLANAAHHGSASSSSAALVHLEAPQNVVISVQWGEHGYFLPVLNVVNRFLNNSRMTTQADLHGVDGWYTASDYRPGYDNEAYNILAQWEESGTPFYSGDLTKTPRYWLKTIPPGGGVWMVVPSKGKILTRTYTQRSVRQTSLPNGNLPFIYFLTDFNTD